MHGLGMGYLNRCFHRATVGSFILTDRLTIATGIVVSALGYPFGQPVAEGWQPYFALAVLYVVAATILVRLVTAPYFIWKEDQGRIAALEAEIADPKRRARAAIEARIGDARVSVLNFLNSYRIGEAVRLNGHERISEYPEIYRELSLLIADDRTLTDFADELERTHSHFYFSKSLELRGTPPIVGDAVGMVSRAELNYTVAKRRLMERLLLKDEAR